MTKKNLFTLVLCLFCFGTTTHAQRIPTLEEAVAAARALQAGGMPPAAAAKQAAAGTPFSKGEIYKEMLK